VLRGLKAYEPPEERAVLCDHSVRLARCDSGRNLAVWAIVRGAPLIYAFVSQPLSGSGPAWALQFDGSLDLADAREFYPGLSDILNTVRHDWWSAVIPPTYRGVYQ
jgi:hypothetical protein